MFIKTILTILKSFAVLIISLVGLALLFPLFWEQVRVWFETARFLGCDTTFFIHEAFLNMKYPAFPVKAWDFVFSNGTPRLFTATWMHFYLIKPLINLFGYYQTLKVYPIASIGLFMVFSYLLFFELSGSILLSLALVASLISSQAFFTPLFKGGMVLSFISQVFFPAQLYFAVRFIQKRKKRDLIFSGIMAALGFYTHGLTMMFFGFIPTFIFLSLATEKLNQFVTRESLKQAFLFAAVALSVGGLAVWPWILFALQGGMGSYALTGDLRNLSALKTVFESTDLGVIWGLVGGGLTALLFLLAAGKKPKKILKPLLALEIFCLFWFLSYIYPGNLLAATLFPMRIAWFYPIATGALAAYLLSPLSDYSAAKIWQKIVKFLAFNFIKVFFTIFIALSLIPFVSDYPASIDRLKNFKWPEFDLIAQAKESFAPVLALLDPSDLNSKLYMHNGGLSMLWIRVADLPQVRGQFHFWTKRSRWWDGWSYGVLSRSNWDSQKIPQDMAEKQGLWFIDWYGVRYLAGITPGKTSSAQDNEFMLAGNFYEDKDYVLKKASNGVLDAFEIAPQYTSGVASAVRSPVVGFVGNDQSYFSFIKAIATLNLNTAEFIPVRLADSIEGINNNQLEKIDALVIWDFKKKFFLTYSLGWNKIAQFVGRGGRVWIDTGGNSTERESENLPGIFPIRSTKYGDVGRSWQVAGPLTEKFNFSSLEKLEYKGTPWQLSYAPEDVVKEGSTVLLTQNGKPVAVENKVYDGLVLWTGLNIFYRPEEYRQNGVKEAGLIKLFFDRLLQGLPKGKVEAKVVREKPELHWLEGQGFSGVVFKQNYVPGWQAQAFYEGKAKTLTVLAAGPEMMYFPLPKEAVGKPVKVEIYYQGAFIHWLFFFLTVIGILVAIEQLLGGFILKRIKLPSLPFLDKGFKFKGVKSWWENEEI